MARFDVYAGDDAHFLDCQADILDFLETRFVVPLVPIEGAPRADRLNPIFKIEDEQVVMATQLASAVPKRVLVRRITSLADEHSRIMNALDMLLTGS